MAKANATNQATSEQAASFVAVEPLRIDGVDIAPGESFTVPAKVAEQLVASGAASAAE